MQKSERVNFGSKIGAILAAAGSAVGLGNIWRFPYETGNHGGAAFILIYLACRKVAGHSLCQTLCHGKDLLGAQ